MDRLIEFISRHWILFSLLAATLLLLGQDLLRGFSKLSKLIQPDDATRLINHENAIVLDIRDDKDFKNGHIINAVHIPLKSLQEKLKKIERYKEKPLIISCRSGQQSNSACTLLAKAGFHNLYNLRGGVQAWQNANLPLIKS